MSSSLKGYHDRSITKRAEAKNFTERINKVEIVSVASL